MTTTAWVDREALQALSPERLSSLIDREVERSSAMLFTLTPREELDAIGRAQELKDLAFAQQVRLIVAASSRLDAKGREFAADELALILGVGPGTAMRLHREALCLAALPGVLEAIEAHWLTERHALSVLRALDEVEALELEQRIAVATIVLARLAGQTPHQLYLMTQRLILKIDLAAAKQRQDAEDLKRRVAFWGTHSGQGVAQGSGPLLQINAIRESLKTWLRDHPKAPDDTRTESEREFDLYVSLLTGGVAAGSWQAAIVVPFSTAAGGDLELAEIPGLGPVLPSTARELLEDADWSQVAVDTDGTVIAVSDPIPAPRPAASKPVARARENWELSLAQLMSRPPKARLTPEQLSSAAYTTPARLRRFLQARDRTCVFPGCHRRVTDVDHRIPWPLGPTAHHNLQLLCRHHHRGKQAAFTVELNDDGDYLWTTRGGWQFLRHRQGY